MGERRSVYGVLVGKPKGKRSLGITRGRWEDDIKMELQEVGCGGTDWIELLFQTEYTVGLLGFWDVMPYCWVTGSHCSEGTCHLHHQGFKVHGSV
jgi:hypothetical protein